MGLFGGAPHYSAPPPPPPPPNPPMMANAQISNIGAAERSALAAAAGMGFDNTIRSSPQGAGAANTAQKSLLGG
jgi:hypothetical protein